jgi:hypothetical protein
MFRDFSYENELVLNNSEMTSATPTRPEMVRKTALGAGDRWFESSRPDQFLKVHSKRHFAVRSRRARQSTISRARMPGAASDTTTEIQSIWPFSCQRRQAPGAEAVAVQYLKGQESVRPHEPSRATKKERRQTAVDGDEDDVPPRGVGGFVLDPGDRRVRHGRGMKERACEGRHGREAE